MFCYRVVDPKIDAKFGCPQRISLNLDGCDMLELSFEQSNDALDFDCSGGALIDLTADGKRGHVLLTQCYLPEGEAGSRILQGRYGLGVELADGARLDRRMVEPPRKDAVESITDREGTVRIKGMSGVDQSGYTRGVTNYS